MKKLLLIFVTIIIAFACGVILVACGTTTEPEQPVPPTLKKSSFSIKYSSDDDGEVNYKLTWDAENAIQYKVVYDGNETVIDQKELLLNGFSADTVHVITVTAIGWRELESDPVEIKFKGVKLDMPTDVRMHLDTKRLDWKDGGDTSAYVISCEELDLDTETSKPIGTGRFKQTRITYDSISLDNICYLYNTLELNSLESFRVRALPYSGYTEQFKYSNDTDIIELKLPSDFSEQSVNLYASAMTNPSNLRWDFDGFDEHGTYAYVKWDGAVANYKYRVMVQYVNGHWSGRGAEKGASYGVVEFDRTKGTGDYTVQVEPECDDIDFIGQDNDAKSTTYSFYLPQPITESLHFRINQTVIDPPKNVRIEGDNIVWDAAEHAKYYVVSLSCGEDGTNFSSDTAQLPLQTIYDRAVVGHTVRQGDFDISVSAYVIDPVLASFENDLPVINSYRYSESGVDCPNKLRLKSIPAVGNVTVDYDNQTISWDPVAEATSYTVTVYYGTSAYNMSVGNNTQFTWDDDRDCKEIIIMATCGYSVTDDDGVVTLNVPSVYKKEL
ncbi:MAG: hypothetical protein K2O39_04095 [Clostridiales bacterium]|nr:hypothetical protein [Clostridiales bacterium]